MMRRTGESLVQFRPPLTRVATILVALLSLLMFPAQYHAQAAEPITPSGLNTQINLSPIPPAGQTQYDITGGTRPGGDSGTNLFHSFGDFGVPPNNIANFLNGVSFDLNGNPLAAGLTTSNILARVTGNIQSDIFGTIQTTGFGNANLFLMNPNGFLFGPNAAVNVGGMATFTSAEYMRLADVGRFNANPNAIQADLLTAAPVAAFGFIGTNPQAIDFNGGQLTVAKGTGVTLVGGDINLMPDLSGAPSGITAPGRQIRLTSVAAGPGEVVADTGVPAPGMALGNITLGQGTILSTAGDLVIRDGSGGPVSIRGGQFVAAGANIITSPAEMSAGSGGVVTIAVSDSATLTETSILTNSLFAGDAGAISITADASLAITNTIIDSTTLLALGDSGAVTLTTNGPLSMTDSTITTRSDFSGNGGAVTVTGMDVLMDRVHVITDVFSVPGLGPDMVRPGAVTVTAQDTITISGLHANDQILTANAEGTLLDAGSVTITGKTVNLSNGTINVAMANSELVSPGNGGAIEIRGNNVNLTQFRLSSFADGLSESTGTGGSILLRGADSIHADNIQLTASQVNASATTGGGGGNIEFQSKLLTVSDHTDVATGSFDKGSGGTITVRGAENVMIESGSQVLTDVVIGLPGTPQGTAGDIFFETQNLTVRGGGLIRAGALPNSLGNAGNITVQGNSPAQSILIDGTGSGIISTAEGTGAGGNINLLANTVTVQNGGTVATSTSGNVVTAKGGNVTITAGQSVNLLNHASVTASSTGPANAGNIDINAGQSFVATNSSVTTEATAASGGTIKITTTPSGTVELTNSTISASVLDGTGGGGSVDIDPQYVLLQNSQILARATEGPGGNITITITNGGLFLPDANSVVSASSGNPALNGTVTIQSPNAPASGQVQPLGQSPLLATSLLNQHCAAMAGGEFSSFTVAGRDSLPTEPGSWLASPLAMLNAGMERGVKAEGGKAEGEILEMPVLSLRQIAPAGFLTQAFAVEGLTSCQS